MSFEANPGAFDWFPFGYAQRDLPCVFPNTQGSCEGNTTQSKLCLSVAPFQSKVALRQDFTNFGTLKVAFPSREQCELCTVGAM